jgi:hypothetical protein
VQLYDTVADISETTNLAAEHPEVVARLQAAWVAHNEELSAHRRPAADLIRPAGVPSPDRPTGDTPAKPLNWARVQQGRTYPTRQAPNLVRKPFVVSCEISGPALEGVLVAHGGTVTGYSLSVHEGQVVFALRRDSDEISRVRATLPQGERFVLRATATENQLAVQIDEAEPATAASTGLLLKHPSEDFSVGFDERMPVDPQQPEGSFTGTVAKVRVSPLNAAD